jgi:hypothetical protein
MSDVTVQNNINQHALEQQRNRDFKDARIAEQKKQQKLKKEQYAGGLASAVKASHVNTQKTTSNKTDAQTKREIRQRQSWYAKIIKARKRKKSKKILTRKYEKIIKGYSRISWMLLYTAAVADAFFDLISVPILSTFMSISFSLYLNLALWSVGEKKDRAKRRLIRASVSVLDLIPIINLIPFSIMIVYKTQTREQKRVKRAKKMIEKINK